MHGGPLPGGGACLPEAGSQTTGQVNESQISDLRNYLTEETDPLFDASPADDIEAADIGNWDEAHGWSDHADAGYFTEETHDLADILSQGNDADANLIKNLVDPTEAQDAATKACVDESAPATPGKMLLRQRKLPKQKGSK